MDVIAITIMFCWAGVIFLFAILFKKEHRRLEDKLEKLKGAETTKYSRKCFSIEWDASQGRQKILAARSFFLLIPMFVAMGIAFLALSIFPSLGYTMFLPFLGSPLLLDDAFQMYKYSRAVQKVPLEMLQDRDQEYMEAAMAVLMTKPKIYFILGLLFTFAAPLSSQLFNLAPLIMAAYAGSAFFLVEKLGLPLGINLMLILFICLPTALLIKNKWTIRQLKRPIVWIISRIRRK